MPWRLEVSDDFKREARQLERDGKFRQILAKKTQKIAEDPLRVGEAKTGALVGFRCERIMHHVIIFEVDQARHTVVLRRLVHHNDRLYDP